MTQQDQHAPGDLSPWRRRAFLPTLLGLATGLCWAPPAAATEVPFATEHTVDSAFNDARSVFAADVDGDGDLDVLGAANTADDIAWWENTAGDGTAWTEHTVDANFDGARSVFAADVDGDGDLDVLGAANTADDIAWWENTAGDGTAWTEHTVDADFNGAQSVFAADVDGDGDLDVLGAAFFDDIAWWENTAGDGTAWTERTVEATFNGARSVFAADVDGDGDLDVLGATSVADDIAWWENTAGDGTAWTEHIVDADFDGARSVFSADVDGDGDLDVLGAASIADDIVWWENTAGDGTAWTERTVDTDFDGARSVFAADVDEDGDLDVLGAADNADDIAWWENTTGNGRNWTEHTVDATFDGARSVFAADVDGDGDLDVLGAADTADDIAWWDNGTIHRNAVFPFRHAPTEGIDRASFAVAADVDGDGDADIVTGDDFDHFVLWWENPGGTAAADSTPWTRHVVAETFNVPLQGFAADLDGDGDTDIVSLSLPDTELAWWENPGGTATTDGTPWMKYVIDSDVSPRSVHAEDIDGDGDSDLVYGGTFGIKWWENPGAPNTTNPASWVEHEIEDDFGRGDDVDAADVDGDGDMDILGAAVEEQEIAWWENPGGAATTDGTPWTKRSFTSFVNARWVDAADMDGDGDTDIVGAGDGISWWENPGGAATTDGTPWTEHNNSFTLARSVVAADMDGDGDLDLLAGSSTTQNNARDVVWWENPGGVATTDGTIWTRHTVDRSFNVIRWISWADFDSDGDPDILAAGNNSAAQVAWWENRGGQFGLPTTSSAPLQIAPPSEAVVLHIHPSHNGRTGDTDVELVTIELLFDDGVTPLGDDEVNSAIDSVHVYRDDGSGVFDGADTEVGAAGPLSPVGGVITISFVDGDMNVEVPFGSTPLYFVVIDFQSGATFNPLRVTHLTESSSTGEDQDHDIPLELEFLTNVSTPEIVMLGGPGAGAGCPENLVLEDQTLSGTQTLEATTSATLGENLTVDGADIAVNAPTVSILNNTSISGPFSVGNTPSCP